MQVRRKNADNFQNSFLNLSVEVQEEQEAVVARSSDQVNSEGPTVALIGCGPSGMFFLHAVETKRRMMEKAGDFDGLKKLPVVTAFEKSSSSGGVWKSDRKFGQNENYSDEYYEDNDYDNNNEEENQDSYDSFDYSGDEEDDDYYDSYDNESEAYDEEEIENEEYENYKKSTTNMYEALWTNGPKENFEFFDYYFEEHFGGMDLPTYMPRQAIIEYITARVTRNNPNIFENVHFNTTVVYVEYDDKKKKCVVYAEDNDTEEITKTDYDKCIWAAGVNGFPRIPEELDSILKKKGFTGKVMHSSDLGNFEEEVEGKRILLVGDAYSGEDLALQAIKLGALHVYIYSRRGIGVSSYVNAWPYNKVTIFKEFVPTTVFGNGTGIFFAGMYNEDTGDYEPKGDMRKTIKLKHISTVVYCTGYEARNEMLDESLWYGDLEPTLVNMPSNWKMKNNTLTEDLGDVEPSPNMRCCTDFIHPGVYNGVLISNPNIMFFDENLDTPLLEIDIQAWTLLAIILGDILIPSEEIMHQQNEADMMDFMDYPEARYMVDSNYYEANQALSKVSEGKQHWSFNITDPRTLAHSKDLERISLRLVARKMRDSGYPLDIGSFEKLNEKGEQYLINNQIAWLCRLLLEENGGSETFRDCNPRDIQSIHTGKQPVPLRKLWIDLEESDYADLLGWGVAK
eukprot:CAMPEP_0113307440 /NCGR_PEP_ID=MMETSP0010_2-20120614/6284_1 /TAXON_ID=216773 ORGANISM="Corethron hystrix, Strain 308" /NCGR_SAMPLE_ID=MMETSP0010_2 /ASSEMBLY_ACC=CAM_ASM_000155 /LENGTH=680 /DNA_ID=CAMNT_0000162295 /DNA_START=411 /DNA_END=2452 /DNA_ORIENTATION=- /assembly_acc=CAM_ASM_000155